MTVETQTRGQRAKTDRLDARVLAHFARAIQPAQRALPDEAAQAFTDQLARRRQWVEMLSMEKTRLKQATNTQGHHDMKLHIQGPEERLRALEAGLRQSVEQLPAWHAKHDLLSEVKGVGEVTVLT
ncbi:transposase [Xanthomonas populi]|nr:transposase [Xanthomonas populi]